MAVAPLANAGSFMWLVFAFAAIAACAGLVWATRSWLQLRTEHGRLAAAGVPIANRKGGLTRLIQGGGQYYFGRGFESMQEVYDICRRGQYKPWVVPGGLLSPPFVVLGTSHDAKDLLTKNVHKGHLPSRLYYPNTPHTVVSSEGKEWRRHRNVLAPALAHKGMRAAVPSMDAVALSVGDFIHSQLQGQNGAFTFDAYNLFSRAVLDVIGVIVYGVGFDAVKDAACPSLAAVHELSKISGRNFSNPLRRLLRIGQTEYRRNENVLDVIAKEQLAKQGSTLLKSIRYAKDEDGVPVWPTDAAFFEEVRLVVNAAHDPAIPMSFALFELATHPKIQARVHRELDDLLGAPVAGAAPTATPITADVVDQMKLLRAVFLEALRMYPVSGVGSTRQLQAPTTLGGCCLPAKTVVVVPFYTVLRNHNEWNDPHTFNPDRFLTGTPQQREARARAASLAFSSGPRMCAGNHLAMFESLAILARTLHSTSFTPETPGQAIEMDCGIHLMPKEARVTARSRIVA